jgi:uncharacterized membrane-anchored protein YhcB (DUF1043 family)
MINEVSLTAIIIVVFLTALLLQIRLLNKVAKQEYNIQDQMNDDGQELHKEGPKVENPN